MLIADCFASIRAKCINTGTHRTGNSVALPMPVKSEQSQPVTFPATPATPETPCNGHDAAYWQEIYEERAAIMEFDGGLARAEAERLAKDDVDALRGVSGVAGVSAETTRRLSELPFANIAR